MKNIVFIGMPGAGKSTFARMLAENLKRSFLDLDDKIESDANMTISDIFAQYGETHFRDLETAAIAEISKNNDQVIACGGGSILRDENYSLLSSNGFIVFIDRPIENIAADINKSIRPLLSEAEDTLKRLSELQNQRRSRYLDCADFVLKNDSSIEDVFAYLIAELQ